MPKDTLDVTGGQTALMDPAGKEFQDMLLAAKTAAVTKLEVKDDTSMVEKDVVEPASSAETTEKDDDLTPPDKEADEPGDDIGNLKSQVSGLKAELTKVRKQKASGSDEANELKERLANLEGQLSVLKANKSTSTLEDKIAQLGDDQLATNKGMWEDERVDARVSARLAEKENDTEGIQRANQRILDANHTLKLYEADEKRRDTVRSKGQSSQDEEKAGIAKDLDLLFTEVGTACPDLFVKDTPIWKAGQEEYSKLPKLMKQLGPLGELVAAATAVAKHPELVGKRVADTAVNTLVNNIEKAADKAFHKGGSAPTIGAKPFTTVINNRADLVSFEDQVRKVKSG